MMKKILFFSVFIFLIVNVFALGISPAKTTFNYKEGFSGEGVIKIFNSDSEKNEIFVSTQGFIKDMIKIEDQRVIFNDGETVKDLRYKLEVPRDISKGIYEGEILFSQSGNSGELVETKLVLESKIVLNVIEDSDTVFYSDYKSIDGQRIKVIKSFFDPLFVVFIFLFILFMFKLIKFIRTHRKHRAIFRSR